MAEPGFAGGLSDAKAQTLAPTLNFLQDSNGQKKTGTERGTWTSVWVFSFQTKSEPAPWVPWHTSVWKDKQFSTFCPPGPGEVKVF